MVSESEVDEWAIAARKHLDASCRKEKSAEYRAAQISTGLVGLLPRTIERCCHPPRDKFGGGWDAEEYADRHEQQAFIAHKAADGGSVGVE